MNPKHKSPKQSNRTAHAPYNFIPLPEKVVTVDDIPPQDVYAGYTGYIECLLTTESPLYTRAGMSPEIFRAWGDKPFHELPEEVKDERAQFFSVDGQCPVIPGSTLRGMIRSLVEIVGYGKVQWVTSEQLIYRAVGDPSSLGIWYREQMLGKNKAAPPTTHLDYPSPRLKGGYLKKTPNGWAIQPVSEHNGESFVHVEYNNVRSITGESRGTQRVYDVFVEPASRGSQNRGQRGPGDLILDIAITTRVTARHGSHSAPPGMVPGTLIESGHMGGRHEKHWHCVIFEPDPSAKWVPISDEMWQIYQEDRDLTRGLGTGTRKLLSDGDPLFYLLDVAGELVFFGPTKMFRLPYPNSPLDLLPPDLRKESERDLAEAIFGYTKSDAIPVKDRACAGRVIITDARSEPAAQAEWTAQHPITPKILGSPKPTSFQHYLTQQEPDDKSQLDHYASPPPHKTTIRGHKLYWHRGNVNLNDIQEFDQEALTDHPKQYTRIKPVRSKVAFKFHIHFENLRDFELGALLWALTLPGEADKQYRHKLGMGKPLGMGSAHLQPTLYLSARKEEMGRYSCLFSKNEKAQILPVWHRAETPDDTQCFIQAFDRYVLAHMDQNERNNASSLAGVPRIQMLLKILEWPGPQQTEYMELERFRHRPVLPDPLAAVAGQPVKSPTPVREQIKQTTSSATKIGVVKKWLDDRGIGSITQEDGSEIRVHHSGIVGSGRKSLQVGQRVSYTVGSYQGRPQAENVRGIKN